MNEQLAHQAEELSRANRELESRVAERTAALETSHEEMKNVSFQLLWAEERERERIAGELHDHVGQSLLLAKMKLDALANESSSDLLRLSAEEVSALIETSIHDVRTLTVRIRPPILETAGIETAMEWLCSSVSDDYGLRIEFSSDDRPKPVSQEKRYSVYQVVRELLLNVIKHSKAEKAQLAIKVVDHNLVAHVIDDGVGFSYSDALVKHQSGRGYGLYNVQQRIEQMGGAFAVESAPGKGARVTLMVPLLEST
jgi:signal transduction histidine kinase